MEQFPFRELEATSLPMVDESVYPTITKPIRSNLDLPFRKLYNIEILDSSGTVHPALDRLKFDGPFMVKGWVPIEETILRREWVSEQKLEDEACIVRSAPTADLPTQSGRATIKPTSTSVHLSKPRAAIMARSTSARSIVTNNLHPPATISAESSVASRTLSAPGAQADSAPAKEGLHVTTPAKRRRDYYFDLSSDTVEDPENVAKLHPSKKTPHQSPAEATILSNSDASEDVVVEIGSTVPPSQSLSDNISGIDESEQGGSDTVSAPLIGQTASIDEDQLPLQPFQQSGAPSPYCALSDPGYGASKPSKNDRAKVMQMRDLVMNRYVGSSVSYVKPDTFICPWSDCLTVIPNSIYPSLHKFVYAVLEHILRHDLSDEEGFMSMQAYLGLQEVQQIHHTTPLLRPSPSRPKTPTISIDLYWLLESGKLSSDLNQGRRYQPRTKQSGPASVVGRSAAPIPAPAPAPTPPSNSLKKYPKRLGRTEN
ncbi:hypothetical protein BGW41_008197 [Actinomortierella wolfii]|nr:hypothetical protein BGW41_008197 [Actinomortierella wolfii]